MLGSERTSLGSVRTAAEESPAGGGGTLALLDWHSYYDAWIRSRVNQLDAPSIFTDLDDAGFDWKVTAGAVQNGGGPAGSISLGPFGTATVRHKFGTAVGYISNIKRSIWSTGARGNVVTKSATAVQALALVLGADNINTCFGYRGDISQTFYSMWIENAGVVSASSVSTTPVLLSPAANQDFFMVNDGVTIQGWLGDLETSTPLAKICEIEDTSGQSIATGYPAAALVRIAATETIILASLMAKAGVPR